MPPFFNDFEHKSMASLEMKQIVNHSIVASGDPRPMEIVGAGPLLSSIWKLADAQAGWCYRFNLTRQISETGGSSNVFQPQDLRHFIKLIQVLATEIAADGCLPQAEIKTLKNLAMQLEELLAGVTAAINKHVPPTA